MTRTEFETMRSEFEAVASKFGYEFKFGRHVTTYASGEVHLGNCVLYAKGKEATIATTGVNLTDAERTRFENAARFTKAEEWFGKTVKVNGQDFTIVEYNARAQKYPVIAANSQGAKYKLSVAYVASHLA